MAIRTVFRTLLRSMFFSLCVVAIIGGLCAIDALYVEPNFPRLIRQEVFIQGLPESLDGLKVVHLSDLHIVRFGKREARALKLVARIEPDLVCLTGDYIGDDGITPGDHTDEYCMRQAARFMSGLHAKYGLYAVSGNWDPLADKREFERAGVRRIDGESLTLEMRGARLRLASFGAIQKQMENKSTKRSRHIPTILLEHFPEVADNFAVADSPVDLVLAGHWHGGQVGWPLKMTDVKYLAGLYRVGRVQLYVSRGLGMHSRAVRFNCPSEVGLIVLRCR